MATIDLQLPVQQGFPLGGKPPAEGKAAMKKASPLWRWWLCVASFGGRWKSGPQVRRCILPLTLVKMNSNLTFGCFYDCS